MPLISRRVLPPGGWMYFQPQTNWKVPNPMMDFDTVVRTMIEHRLANPRFHLPTDETVVADELDLFTCIRLAYDPHYCTGGPLPKAQRPSPGRLVMGFQSARKSAGAVVEKAKKYVIGIGVLINWLGSGAKAVSQEQANQRAETCVKCPKNQPGDIESIFTESAAKTIREYVALKNEMKLATPYDDKLKICNACLCVTATKVWTPLEHVIKKLTPEMDAELHESCWIKKERMTP